MSIAFVGLGNMGGGMAMNLARSGQRVRAFDLSEAALERARENGCDTFISVEEAVRNVDAVITMLPNGKIVEDVYLNHIIDHAPRKALLIDCSTIDVATARKVAEAAGDNGYEVVDAPVSGGIGGANQGTLTFMVGGGTHAFRRAEGILLNMGKAVIHAGASGAGQAVKICNNMLLGIHMIGTCEAFALAGKLGLNLDTFYNIASQSSGQCWSMTSYCPVPGVGPRSPADNNFEGGFTSALMLKDLRLAVEAAADSGSKVPMGSRAKELYEAFAAENGALDFSAIIKTL